MAERQEKGWGGGDDRGNGMMEGAAPGGYMAQHYMHPKTQLYFAAITSNQ